MNDSDAGYGGYDFVEDPHLLVMENGKLVPDPTIYVMRGINSIVAHPATMLKLKATLRSQTKNHAVLQQPAPLTL